MEQQCPYYGGREEKGKTTGIRCGNALLTIDPEAAVSQEDYCVGRSEQSPMECRAFLVQSIHDKAVNIRSNHTIAELQTIFHKVKNRPGCIGCDFYWYSAGYENAAPHPDGVSGYEGWKQWMANSIPCEILTHYCRPDTATLYKITEKPQTYCQKPAPVPGSCLEEGGAMTYYTKCGREFAKSSKAVVTGYHLTKLPNEEIHDEQCKTCPFVVDVQEGYPQVHKRYECRAGSEPPNHETTYRGSVYDKCTMQIDSLDHELLERIRFWCIEHPDLSASYNADCMADCRRSLSISCSQNKKGIAAKQELVERFFPTVPATPDPDFEPETCGDCDYYSDNACNADSKPKPVRGSDAACGNFCPPASGIRFFSSREPEEDAAGEEQLVGLLDQSNGVAEKLYQPKCPYLGSIGEKEIRCELYAGKCLGTVAFDSHADCQDKASHDCFDRFLDCEHYRKYYMEQLAVEGADVCIHCCNNSWYTGLPKGYSGQEWCFCQLEQEPVEHHDPACEWFNRHPDWSLPRTGLQGCQEMREDCLCFCKHNDGCAALLTKGSALENIVKAWADKVDCAVFARVTREVLGTIEKTSPSVPATEFRCGDCVFGHWYSGEHKYISRVTSSGGTKKIPCEPHTHYCGHFDNGRRKIAGELDFEPNSVPEWCPRGEEVRMIEEREAKQAAEAQERFAALIKPEPAELAADAFDYSQVDENTAAFLHQKTVTITGIRVRSVIAIGKELKEAQDKLASHNAGTFEKWVRSIGISDQTARNYINGYEWVGKNFANLEDADSIQPSLLFAASKPSAPPELAQAVVDGDITKHKDYQEALKKLKKAEDALAAQQTIERDYRNRLSEVERDTAVRAKERERLTKEAEEQQQAILRLEQQINQLKRNADPAKVQELGEIIREKQEEIAELRQQVKDKPLEVSAAEVVEMIPEGIAAAWCANIQMAIYQLADLSEDDLTRIVKRIGSDNYAVLKQDFRLNAMRAKETMDNLISMVLSVPAPAAEFAEWAKG